MNRKITGALERDPRKGICDHPDCNNKLKGRRRTFCSDECGTLFLYENNWSGLRYLAFLKDLGICQNCNSHLVYYQDNVYYSFHKFPNFVLAIMSDVYDKLHSKYLKPNSVIYKHQRHIRNKSSCYGSCQDKKKLEVDHIKAIGLGGDPLSLDNLQVLCHDCHSAKTGRDVRKMNGTYKGTLQTKLEDYL